MRYSKISILVGLCVGLNLLSCKDSQKSVKAEVEVEAEVEPSLENDDSAQLAKQRAALAALMPTENLDQLGTQISKPLGGMYTAREEFKTYPFNLGPTGITALRVGGSYTVSVIAKGSPADGKVSIGDSIIGANGRLFSEDQDKFPEAPESKRRFPNPQMGMAIENAEANDGKLTLIIGQGKAGPKEVTLKLRPLGAMDRDFPNSSVKAEFLAALQAEIILAHQNSEGGWGTGLLSKGKAGSRTKLIPTCMCALALMSADDAKYTPAIKQAFELMLTRKIKSFHTWQYAYLAAFFTEYEHRYGDPRVKPAVQEMVNKLADGYFYYNGVYGYGHSLNGGNYRYGGINVCTAHAAYALAMGRVLGCEMPNQIDVLIAKSLERIAPDGAMDYAWGARRKGETPSKRNEDQCRTGIGSMAYYYLGGRPEHYQKFLTYLLKNSEHADGGHATGGTLSWASSGLSLAMADDAKFEKYMQSKIWQFAFNRTHDHGYYLQPSPHGQHRGSDQAIGGHYVTATNTILFNRYKKNLIITGMTKGIPEVKPSYLTEVLAASDYYERQGRIVDVIEAAHILGEPVSHAIPELLKRLKSIPIESPSYEAQVDKNCDIHLPMIARDIANAPLSDEQRSAAIAKLIGVNYSRSLKEVRGKLVVTHLFTPPHVGEMEIRSDVVMQPGKKTHTKKFKIKAGSSGKLQKADHKGPFSASQDLELITTIRWNGIQLDFPFTYKKEDSKYLASKEGIRGSWSKKPWETSYGLFYGKVKRTKSNGCLQVIYPEGTVFETALMNNALVHYKGKTEMLGAYLKKQKLKRIPDGTKIKFKYFHRGGKPALPMCDEIFIVE